MTSSLGGVPQRGARTPVTTDPAKTRGAASSAPPEVKAKPAAPASKGAAGVAGTDSRFTESQAAPAQSGSTVKSETRERSAEEFLAAKPQGKPSEALGALAARFAKSEGGAKADTAQAVKGAKGKDKEDGVSADAFKWFQRLCAYASKPNLSKQDRDDIVAAFKTQFLPALLAPNGGMKDIKSVHFDEDGRLHVELYRKVKGGSGLVFGKECSFNITAKGWENVKGIKADIDDSPNPSIKSIQIQKDPPGLDVRGKWAIFNGHKFLPVQGG